jgi:hypothetical protein
MTQGVTQVEQKRACESKVVTPVLIPVHKRLRPQVEQKRACEGSSGAIKIRLTPLPRVRSRPVDKIHGGEAGRVEHYPYQASG